MTDLEARYRAGLALATGVLTAMSSRDVASVQDLVGDADPETVADALGSLAGILVGVLTAVAVTDGQDPDVLLATATASLGQLAADESRPRRG